VGNGASITIGPADVAEFDTDTGLGQSNAPVQVGEVLTERQLLEGLLVHSANNLAGTLARWDAGSIPAFVAKMNAAASAMGLHTTHFVDASGYAPQSVSTAADILRVAGMAMRIPVFAQDVAMPSVNLPVSGMIGTYTPLLGVDGVFGVKSGFTSAAGGCDVMASSHVVDGHTVTVLSAVTGVTGPGALEVAGHEAYNLGQAAAGGLVSVPLLSAGQRVGVASAEGHRVPVVAGRSLALLAWPEEPVTRRLVVQHRLLPGDPLGTPVGSVRISVGGRLVTSPVTTAAKLPPPTLVQRLF
jgi:D-alanyl-D-alanine carboxypeptidase (penicillin-binding protein 5/6)